MKTPRKGGIMISQMTAIRNICVQTVQLESCGICTYTLTEENLPVCGKSYRITVTLDNANLHFTESVRDVTTLPDMALRLFWKVCRGQVTPLTLRDVLTDLLSE